ncbi:MAG: DoxX family protein [Actinomycetota bacterium]
MDVGMLILRLVVGLTIWAHGAQKVVGWFGGPGIEGTTGMVRMLGFRPPRPMAWLSGLAEFAGGLLLVLGFASPLGAAAVVGAMTAAVVTVHWRNGFFVTKGGYEFNLALAAGAAAIAFAGPGGISLDAAFGWHLAGLGWGFASSLVGVATALGVLASRRPQPEQASPGQRAEAA